MAFFDRWRRTPELRTRHGLVASAATLNLHDSREVRRLRQLRQGWQDDAWNFREQIGEIAFGERYMANSAKRLRLFPAIYPTGSYDDDPVPFDEVTGVPDAVIECSNDAMAALGTGRIALSQIMHDVTTNFYNVGEGFIVGTYDDQVGEQWRIRSISEIVIKNDGLWLREIPQDLGGGMGWTQLDVDTTYVARIWNPNPRFRMLADSSVKNILNLCDELLLSERGVRASLRSRLRSNSILKVPTGLRVNQPMADDNLDPESDPWAQAFYTTIQEPISDEGAASAIVPIVVRGGIPDLEGLQILPFPNIEALQMEQRKEMLTRMANGLSVPASVLLGTAEVNHWSQWFISDDTFRTFHEPNAQTAVDALSVGYLRARLIADPRMAQFLNWVSRVCIWYDPTDLIVNPNRMADATTLFNARVISEAAFRKAGGYTEDDAPDIVEVILRMTSNQRTWSPQIQEALVHRLDPTLLLPALGVGGTLPEEGGPGDDTGPGGLGGPTDPGDDPNDVDPAASGTPDNHGPPASGPPTGAPALTAGARPRANHMLSRRLVEIDREARAALQAAANAEVKRVLDRAGAKIVTKLRGNNVNGQPRPIPLNVRNTPPHLVASTVGADEVARLGLTASDLTTSDWTDLRTTFFTTLEAAAADALAIVRRLTGLSAGDPILVTAATKLATARQAAWSQFSDALNALTAKYLYSPLPSVDTADALAAAERVASLVPTGVVRSAMSVAGGVSAQVTAGFPNAGNVTATLTARPAGLGGGDIVSDALTAGGSQIESYQWVTGSPVDPFEPHQDLDGVTFTSWDDPVLLNPTGWPSDLCHPGDHPGCACDAWASWTDATQDAEAA